ncbi:N-acetylglucosaminyl-phosphatidylinositol biosynthetic protein gpi1 isoform X3 [Cucumis melo var. makuwa]|uniref:N-acetylglucosaminyl-phosphatidylinositol biosynthetic protein gpi1 isoform X3 n=2 Tax=Cucumis melo TaxID=3656 RepID=A0A5A7TUU9_CUCMM|nr:N-acetylglucosaminyl-phosphatidylinositol biosynthetic protein gpi1 isoform X3 [Cucumis melo var. makuwa]
MKGKCRLWWPKQHSPCEQSSSYLLFGWFIPSSDSLDVVVAFTCTDVSLSRLQCDIKEIINDTDSNMPAILQDKSVFSLLGQCVPKLCSDGVLSSGRINVLNGEKNSCYHYEHGRNSEVNTTDSCGRLTPQFHHLGGVSEQCRQVYSRNSNWLFLEYDSDKKYENSEVFWIPKLDYLCWNGQKVSNCDVHVIIYDSPVYNCHHFSLLPSSSREQESSSFKKPKWVDVLKQKELSFDLDTVILAINCATAAKRPLERHLHTKRSPQISIVDRCYSFIWSLLAMSIASLSTLFYMTFQFSYKLHSIGSQLWMPNVVSRIFMTACINVRIRCCQILYWPIILQERGMRSLSNVEFAEKFALQKHSMWTSIAADVLLGNVFGVALLCYADFTYLLISNLARDITNHILRSGCVWLMGVPAGFKLNIELAGVLGIISLNAIQIWSTLWFFFGFIFIYVIKALAILGILFGVTLPAGLTSDLISIATYHVSTLHWFISLIYSSQIQALAALWRIFRGQKQNPLRNRIDSYDYIVKQHIVGSLIFTPLLLLLPTTSVFYVFFTILNQSISFIRLLIGVIISAIHATPFTKIFLWLVKRKTFPSGIWFEIISCHINSTGRLDRNSSENLDLPTKILDPSGEMTMRQSSVLVSCLHSNLMGIEELVLPHYRNIFSGFSRSILASTFHGVLTGRRTTSMTLKLGLPSPMPWMCIPYREYWHLCYSSILTCRKLR